VTSLAQVTARLRMMDIPVSCSERFFMNTNS
jgi:hypothetical protein